VRTPNTVDVEPDRLRTPQPRALIVTAYGLYARESGGWLSVRSLIKLLAEVGVDDQAVRSAISRLKRRGMLVAQKRDGLAGYALSEHARSILLEGDRRIFRRPSVDVEDQWLLAVFSVPESEREKRHQLRSKLSWLGFGTVSSGVWIAPAHVEEEARDVLEGVGLDAYVDLFRAEHAGFRPLPEQVADWWDLEDLERMYDDFVAAYRPVRDSWRRRRKEDDAAAFADYLQLLTSWRRLPYLDPGLPSSLLPAAWRGAEAADIFFELRERLTPAAHRHVETVSAPGRS
jgi:phenylacetic acid degradation operon negative regulatory protein